MVGTSSGTAPNERSRDTSPADCSFVRGTRTRQPNSGRVSNQDSDSRSATTSPITVSPAGSSGSCGSALPMSANVAATVRCSVVVPAQVVSTGVAGSRPASTNLAAAPDTSAVLVVLVTTRVASLLANAAQSTFGSCASTTRTSRTVRLVSGTPANTGTALIGATPGTTWNSSPAFRQAAASSASVPLSPGSPSISRTTRRPPLAAVVSTLARAAGVNAAPAASNAPSSTVTSGPQPGRYCSRECSARTTTWASASSSTARMVSRPGSPGPAPTNATEPAGRAGLAGAAAGAVLALALRVGLIPGAPNFRRSSNPWRPR